MSATRIPLILGTMTIGARGQAAVRNDRLEECQEILDVFYKHGHKEIDTARVYGNGTTEEYLAQLNTRDSTIDTKCYPTNPGDHHPQKLRETLETSLQKLNRSSVRVFYLHAPDRSVPFEDTVKEVNTMFEEGLFEIFGLSNFAAWEVAEIVTICRKNNWVQPKIYQAMYNAITRGMEVELVPCCRKFGMRIVVYNPLAGGLFSGKISSINDSVESGSRFDLNAGPGKAYRQRYFKDGYFQALALLKEVAENHKLRLPEIALRWVQHHSVLEPGDGVIVGASSAAQLDENCLNSEKGPLPAEVVDALYEAYKLVGFDAPTYWR